MRSINNRTENKCYGGRFNISEVGDSYTFLIKYTVTKIQLARYTHSTLRRKLKQLHFRGIWFYIEIMQWTSSSILALRLVCILALAPEMGKVYII